LTTFSNTSNILFEKCDQIQSFELGMLNNTPQKDACSTLDTSFDMRHSWGGGVEIFLVASCYRNWDKLWPDGPL